MASPSNQPKLVQALYDSAATSYEEAIIRTNYIGPKWLMENLQPSFKTPQLRVLDVGCGTGLNIANLHKKNPSILPTGIDISQKMIAEAKKMNLYDSLHCSNLDDGLAFLESECFNMTIALGCLEFVNNLDFCLREIADVCVDNSFLYATFQQFKPNDPSAPRLMRSGEVLHFAYSQEEIFSKLDRLGFKQLVAEEKIGYTGGAPCPYLMVVAQKVS